MSAADLESLYATLELVSDRAAVERIAESKAAVAHGELTTRDEMVVLMEQRRRRGP
jgi:PHD/YefM family antitoxin component YafN of YafNO toxin-antitoxin module